MTSSAENTERLWTRAFVSLMAINFCTSMCFYLLNTMLATYSMKTFGVSSGVAALTVSVFIIAALVARVALGAQIDRWGIQKSLVIGLVSTCIVAFLYVFPLDFVPLLVVRAAHGVGFALVSGATASAAAIVIPEKRYGEGIGYYTTAMALSTGIGPFLAIALVGTPAGYHAMFVAASIASALALACLVFVRVPAVERPASEDEGEADAESGASKRHGIGSLIQIAIIPLACVMLLTYFCYGGVLSFGIPYAESIGLEGPAQFFFLAYSVAIVLTRPPIGKIVDRRGENSMMYPVQVALVAGLIVLACTLNGFMLIAAAVLLGVGVGATQSISQTILAHITPKAELGRANSTFMMFVDLGSGISPMVIGLLIPLTGFRLCYAMLAVLAVCSLVLYYFVHGRKASQRQK